MNDLFPTLQKGALAGLLVAGALLLGFIAYLVVIRLARYFARRTGSAFDQLLAREMRGPARVFLPVVALFLALPAIPVPAPLATPAGHATKIALVASIGWILARLTNAIVEYVHTRYEVAAPDNLRARTVQTRFELLRRIVVVAIAFVTLSLALMTFPSIRRLGLTMFASAGIAGLAVGLAARPVLANVIAGLQLAFTEPIRLDDVVVVEGEWGRIEWIGATYVVVRIWDLRRLVLPLTYFIERPFQNWTRVTADLLATVFVYADYTVPVDAVRAELHRILASSGLWDGKTWGLQVTNATERALELRALMSAPDSSSAWDLRCHVREKLIGFLREKYPDCLPRTRAELRDAGPGPPRPGEAPNGTRGADPR
jgi:small-conductance mechanosensitive channel